MCLRGNEGGMFSLRIITSPGLVQGLHTQTVCKCAHALLLHRGTGIPVTDLSQLYELAQSSQQYGAMI